MSCSMCVFSLRDGVEQNWRLETIMVRVNANFCLCFCYVKVDY